MEPEHVDCAEYNLGYRDGQAARRSYINELCDKNNLLNPEIHPNAYTKNR